MDNKRLRIVYITAEDAHDRRSLSGAPYYVSRVLQAYCGDVHYIHRLKPSHISPSYLLSNLTRSFTWIYAYERLKQLFWKFLKKKYDWNRTRGMAYYYARQIKKQLRRDRYDIIFAEQGSILLAYLKTDIPIVYSSDTTFAAMLGYYPDFFGLAPSALRQGHAIEGNALRRASLFLCLSQWAADSAMKDYGMPQHKILVLPRFSSFDNVPDRFAVLAPKQRNICRLLLVGVDWTRKGCDIAVEAANTLNALGVPAMLSVCGCLPPEGYVASNHVELVGYLNKNEETQRTRLEHLYLDASFFLLPTRAECMGNVFVEAAAFGLPSIATDTGGVPSVVINGETGFLLKPEATGKQYASVIKSIWEDEEKYTYMRNRARDFFESLSGEHWGSAVLERLSKLAKNGRSPVD